MGNADTKLNFRKAVVQLTSKTQVCVGLHDYLHHDYFDSQFIAFFSSPLIHQMKVFGPNSGLKVLPVFKMYLPSSLQPR